MAYTAGSWRPIYIGGTVTRRRFVRGAAAGAGAAFLAACGGSDGGGFKLDDSGTARQPGTVWFAKNDWKLADETKQAVRGGIYRHFRIEDIPSHLDPIPQTNSAVPTSDHTYQLLMARNRGPGIEPGSEAYNHPTGSLAEDWEVSPDGTTYTFTLRQGVKFQNLPPVNGRVMDMDDWKTSQDRHLAVGVFRNAIGDELDKVEYPDSRHMVWKFKLPFAPVVDRVWDSTFGFFILPKELNADPKIAEQRAIGTGFKILDRNQPSIGIEYRKHPEYWGGDPFIERWHEPIIPEYSNQYAQFVRGNITNFTPTARDVLLLKKDAPGAVIVANPIPENSASRHRWGRINPGAMPWKDARVRIAMRRSIDWTGIAQFLSNKTEFEAAGVPIEIRMMTHVMQNPAYWLDPEKNELGEYSQNYIYNVAEAKKLAAAAGFDKPIDMPYYVSGTGDIAEPSLLVINSLKQTGVFNLDVKQVPANDYRVNINIDGKYDGAQEQSGASGNDNDYVVYRDYHSQGRPGSTQAFPDPRMDVLATAQRREVDFAKRAAVYKDVQMYLAQTMILVPGRSLFTTFQFRWPWLHNATYASTTTGPGGSSPELGGHLHWLDASMPNRDKAT